MLNRLKSLLRVSEQKASRTARLIALESGGRPRWTPRDYAALAREGYARNAIVYRAVRLIAESVGALSFVLYEGVAERDIHPLLDLIRRPNPRQDGASFLESIASHLLLAGNAYIEAVGLGAGEEGDPQVRELYALRPDRMKLVPGADGWPQAYDYTVAGSTVRFDQSAMLPPILHLTFFNPLDDHYGLSPLEAAAIAVDTHNAAAAWNKALLDNAARPSGALVYDGPDGAALSALQYERLKNEFADHYQGMSNAGRPLVLEGGLDWKPMSLSPERHGFSQREARGRARDRARLRRAADAARDPRRQYLFELPGSQSRVLASERAAAGGTHCLRADALAVACVRRWPDARRRYRQDRGSEPRSRGLVGARQQGAVPQRQREAAGNRVWSGRRRRRVSSAAIGTNVKRPPFLFLKPCTVRHQRMELEVEL